MKSRKIILMIIIVFCIMLFAFYFAACGNDNNHYHAHSFSEYVYNNDATCIQDGTETAKCAECGETDTRTKANTATGVHSYVDYICEWCYSISPNAPISEGLDYTEIKDGEIILGYSVTMMGSAINNKYFKIPNEHNGKPVISIGKDAFQYDNGKLTTMSGMVSVEIPNSVTDIGDSAFSDCINLKSVAIGNGLTRLGDSAFSGCRSLSNIKLPSSVTSIGNGAFYGCVSLTDIKIPDGVDRIGDATFANCDSLSNIVIPNSITSIGDRVFDKCNSLQYYEYDSGLYLGNEINPNLVFVKVKSSDIITCSIHANTKLIYHRAFAGCYRLSSVNISTGITSIGMYAFNKCICLTSIEIPDSVTEIKRNAFANCRELRTIEIPKSVTSIESGILGGCDTLARITVSDENPKYHSSGNCIVETKSKELIVGCKNSVIVSDGSVTSIGEYAFLDCNNLISIQIPNTVMHISTGSFRGCSSLTSLFIPLSVKYIDITAGETDCAFYNCNSLTLYCEAADKPQNWYRGWNSANCPVIWDCNNNDIDENGYAYTVIDGIRYALKDGEATVIRQPSNISGAITIPTNIIYRNETYNVTSIGDSAFLYVEGIYTASSGTVSENNVTSLIIPNTVTSIGEHAFGGCYSLTSIVIPKSVEKIDRWAFAGIGDQLTIYCEAAEKPIGWNNDWNHYDYPVVWGYNG